MKRPAYQFSGLLVNHKWGLRVSPDASGCCCAVVVSYLPAGTYEYVFRVDSPPTLPGFPQVYAAHGKINISKLATGVSYFSGSPAIAVATVLSNTRPLVTI